MPATTPPQPSITCPECGMTSHHPMDIRAGYCGNCHDYTSADTDLDAQLAQILRRSAALPPLDTTGLTLDEAVTATIRQVVATSPLRLRPPESDPT